MTLVEVVVGLAILGTLLATVLVARARHLHQLALAERKQVAIAAADALLSKWFADDVPFPRNDRGDIASDDKLRWRTTVLPDPLEPVFEAEKVRLEIFERQAADSAMPLVSVEVVLPKPPTTQAILGAP